MIEKQYCVKRQGAQEWQSVLHAYTYRKAAIAFAEENIDLRPEDTIVVIEKGGEEVGSMTFKVAKLFRSEVDEKESAPEPIEDKSEVQPTVISSGDRLDKADLRRNSAYKSLRGCVTILAVASYIVAVITILFSINASLKLEAEEAVLLCILNGALVVIGIYVAQALVQAFIDIADVMLTRSVD